MSLKSVALFMFFYFHVLKWIWHLVGQYLHCRMHSTWVTLRLLNKGNAMQCYLLFVVAFKHNVLWEPRIVLVKSLSVRSVYSTCVELNPFQSIMATAHRWEPGGALWVPWLAEPQSAWRCSRPWNPCVTDMYCGGERFCHCSDNVLAAPA